ncbi:MAG: Uma2 family endonuclease [Rhodothermaceae bacterium]|nr:Uma2 family endonuclease [Rhodothermaceae bacterium]
MSGASRNHVALSTMFAALLIGGLRERKCGVFTSDLRVHIPSTGLYTYPDVAAVCGEERFLDDEVDTLLNPVLITEVLSASTEDYDRGRTAAFYREIESLEEYVVVAQDRKAVEVYRRLAPDHWELFTLHGEGATAELASVGVRVELDALYAQVRFDDDAPQS